VIYKAKVGQASYGEAIGILLLDASNPFIPGDVANATTYDFPVRFQKVKGFSVERALGKDPTIFNGLLAAARELESQGVRAITGDCGFMGLHQRELAGQLTVPVFLSSLLQIPFILSIMAPDAKLGIITADSRSLDNIVLEAMGIPLSDHLKIIGLQDETYFKKGILDEVGILDTEKLENEVVKAAEQLLADDDRVKSVLLECSCLPPYGAAVQKAVGVPVFDYITMINFVFSAVVKQKYEGYM
jgi:hypothetical protein